MEFPWKSVWIVGASSGIGAEAAQQLAAGGCAVTITARRAALLQALAADNEKLTPLPLDITDRAAAEQAVASLPVMPDLVILNAAIYTPMGLKNFDAEAAGQMMRVNYGGIVNVLAPVMQQMVKAGRGHIALVCSPSGYRGLPGGAGYGPTKAALINLAESLRPELERKGVRLSIVNPGFVRTQLTDKNRFKMPQLMEPDQAAAAMLKGLARGKWEVAFPQPMLGMMKALSVLPAWAFFALTKRLA